MPIATNEIIDDILAQGRVSNPDIDFAHSMLNAAGFDPQGATLPTGRGELPTADQFSRVGADLPAPEEPEEPDERGLMERAGRLGVMVLRAPSDVAGNVVDQLDKMRLFTVGKLRASMEATAANPQLGLLSFLAAGPELKPDEGMVGFGDWLDGVTSKVLASPEGSVERTVNDVAKFTVGMIPAVKALQSTQAASTLGTAATISGAGAATEFFAMDPDTPSVIDLVSSLSPELQGIVKKYIKSDLPDETAEEQLTKDLHDSGVRALFDGLLLGALFEGATGVWRLLRHGHRAKKLARTSTEVPRLQEAPIGPGGRTSRGRQIPPGRTGPGAAAPRAAEPRGVIEVGPAGSVSAPRARSGGERLALPPGAPKLALTEAMSPTQVADDVFGTLKASLPRNAAVSAKDVETAITVVAKRLGKDEREVAEMFRLGQKLLAFESQGFRSPIREVVPTVTTAEGTTTAATDFWRQVLGPEDEAAKTLGALVGLVGAGGAAAVLGLPETDNELVSDMQEAGILGSAARGLAKMLRALSGSLDDAAERGATGREAAARGVRQLVHDGPLVTEAAEEVAEEVAEDVVAGVVEDTITDTATDAAMREITKEQTAAELRDIALQSAVDAPTRITVEGVRKDVHFGKIDSDQEVHQVLMEISDIFESSITEGRRLGTPMNAEAGLARTMGMTVDDLHAFAQTASILPKVAAAANEMLVASGTRLEALRTAVVGGSVEAEEAFLKQFVMHGAIQRSVGAIRAESGRTLGMYRLDRTGNIELMHSMTEQARRVGKKVGMDVRKLARLTEGMEPAKRSKIARDMTKPTTTGALLEYWMNAILSGPKTIITNLGGSSMGMLLAPSERFLTTQWSKILGGDAVSGEATAMTYGMLERVPDALRLFAETFRTGQSSVGTRFEFTRVPQFTAEAFRVDPTTSGGAFINGLGQFIRTPGRILLATDDAVKLILYSGEMRAQATRAARLDGIPAGQLDEYIDRFMRNPPETAIANANKTADVYTFTNALGDKNASFQTLRSLAIGVQVATQRSPLLKFVAPFVRTPVNLATFSAERSPVLNLLSSTFRAQLSSTTPAIRAEALTKLSMSGMLMAAIGSMSAAGLVTGSGPQNSVIRKRQMDEGLQYNSIRVGDRWMNIDRADPLGLMFSTAADVAAVIGIAREAGIPERDINSLASAAVLSFANAFTNKTYLRGVAKMLDAIRGGTFREGKLDALSRIAIDTVAGGLVPNVVAEIRRATDRTRREMDGMLARFINRIPGWSRTLPPKTNDWGEPVLYGYGIGEGMVKGTWNFLAPFNVTKIRQHRAAEILADNDVAFNGPSDTFRGEELTPQEHNAYKKVYGDIFRSQLEQAATLPAWERLTTGPEGGKARMVGRIRARALRQAQGLVLRDREAFGDLHRRLRASPSAQRLLCNPGLVQRSGSHPRSFLYDTLCNGAHHTILCRDRPANRICLRLQDILGR